MQTTGPAGRPHRIHGLFSAHYLNVTLPGRPDRRSLAGEAEAAMAQISRVLDAYVPSQNEAQTEEDLVRPVLRLLGHEGTYEVQPALAAPEGPKRPDYVFYRDAASREANKGPEAHGRAAGGKLLRRRGHEVLGEAARRLAQEREPRRLLEEGRVRQVDCQ